MSDRKIPSLMDVIGSAAMIAVIVFAGALFTMLALMILVEIKNYWGQL